MRVVMIASAPPAAIGFAKVLSELGHEIPAVAAIGGPHGRYTPDHPLALHRVVPDADLFFMFGRRLGDLLRAYAADVALGVSFPARILMGTRRRLCPAGSGRAATRRPFRSSSSMEQSGDALGGDEGRGHTVPNELFFVRSDEILALPTVGERELIECAGNGRSFFSTYNRRSASRPVGASRGGGLTVAVLWRWTRGGR